MDSVGNCLSGYVEVLRYLAGLLTYEIASDDLPVVSLDITDVVENELYNNSLTSKPNKQLPLRKVNLD